MKASVPCIDLLLLALCGLLLPTGCKKASLEPISPEPGYLSVQIAAPLQLRAHPADQYSINSDTVDEEDRVREIRLFLLQGDEVVANLYWNLAWVDDFDATHRIVFRIDNPGVYDLVAVANEHGLHDRQQADAFSAALAGITRRADFAALPRIQWNYPDVINSEYRLRAPMTAAYRQVDLTEPGPAFNPKRIVMPEPSRSGAIELLRTVAKVELTLKSAVERYFEPGELDPHYRWLSDGKVQRLLRITAIGLARSYPIFPDVRFTPGDELVWNDGIGRPICVYMQIEPHETCVVKPEQFEENAIGGVVLLDYKIHFYIPETLLNPTIGYQHEGAGSFVVDYNAYDSPTDTDSPAMRSERFYFHDGDYHPGDYAYIKDYAFLYDSFLSASVPAAGRSAVSGGDPIYGLRLGPGVSSVASPLEGVRPASVLRNHLYRFEVKSAAFK